ncbi:PAS domain S-box protein [Acinetobacter sp. ANC 4635]|nr:PAS domain S-box protein [Acinetobacter sp. ANC 4635]
MMNNNELAELIIEQTSDAVIYADNHGNIQRWNDAASQLFGFSKAEILGQSLDAIIPERSRNAHWQGFNMAIQNGNLKLSGKPTLTRAVHKDVDKKLYVEMSFSLVKDNDGYVQGSVAIARDVTESVAQKKLK